MADSVELGDYLRAHGHRLTKPRQRVWEALLDAGGHITADQVSARAGPGVNLASVYRSLTLFTEIGLARVSNLGSDGPSLWEPAHPDDQFHLVCESCGGVEHHGGDLVSQVREHLGADHGFEASTIELSVKGRCARCAG